MPNPPFKFATVPVASAAGFVAIGKLGHVHCCDATDAAEAMTEPQARPRARLADLDPHLHCSIIGTCLSTAALRKLMSRFAEVRDASDLEVHHEAVAMTARGGPVAKALHKALDQQHELALQRFARARGAEALGALWNDALREGEIPGAYWALLTHRHVTPALRQSVFGDVHMLSHLVGAANRADIRRLVALERDNAELHERVERQQLRSQEMAEEHARAIAGLRQQLIEAEARASAPAADTAGLPPARAAGDERAAAQVALQTLRRELAEQAASRADGEASRLRDELAHLHRHADALSRELTAAETLLRAGGDGGHEAAASLAGQLRGRRILYVGGRPSSTPAVRDLVLRHGGEFQRHDGGLEDRKGLLASGVAWAQLVVFPVDCVDHDSAARLKRLCIRQGIAFVPMRSASVASFAAAVAASTVAHDAGHEAGRRPPPTCLKHG